MATVEELQKLHESRVDELLRELSGRGRDSDWALVRALVHRAVHLNADRKAGEFCALATFLSKQIGHAHELLHGRDRSASTHGDFLH